MLRNTFGCHRFLADLAVLRNAVSGENYAKPAGTKLSCAAFISAMEPDGVRALSIGEIYVSATEYDCLIVGGGPAGLTAAIYLARYRRSIALFDAGESRAAWIPESHNYPGFAHGVSGTKLLSILRQQLGTYDVAIVGERITSLQQSGDGFLAGTDSGRQVAARSILICTGIIDESPSLQGLEDAVEQGAIRFCPVCDGYEVTGQRIGVLGHGDDAVGKAEFLRTYSTDVTLLNVDGGEASAGSRRALDQAGIKVAGPVTALQRDGNAIRVLAADGDATFDVVYPALGCQVRSDLARALGASTNKVGCLEVDAHQRTTVPGIYAAGDVVSDLHQIAVATGHAAIAATHIHKSLPHNFL
jgi:thioredoxin reductase (NADPH)